MQDVIDKREVIVFIARDENCNIVSCICIYIAKRHTCSESNEWQYIYLCMHIILGCSFLTLMKVMNRGGCLFIEYSLSIQTLWNKERNLNNIFDIFITDNLATRLHELRRCVEYRRICLVIAVNLTLTSSQLRGLSTKTAPPPQRHIKPIYLCSTVSSHGGGGREIQNGSVANSTTTVGREL